MRGREDLQGSVLALNGASKVQRPGDGYAHADEDDLLGRRVTQELIGPLEVNREGSSAGH